MYIGEVQSNPSRIKWYVICELQAFYSESTQPEHCTDMCRPWCGCHGNGNAIFSRELSVVCGGGV